ncbi:MAG: DUF512 domain-containing protein [Calditrichaeota bacterium]|nr:MAG: DUF512 domain-containing protein [Calditrichota bacterium]
MKIIKVSPKSIAAELGIRPGDHLVKINGHPIRDHLDYQFFVQEDQLELEIERQGEMTIYELEFIDEDLGMDFAEMKCLSCGNHCVFCFVDQNPPNVRPTLFFKDEDYRMSFIYGNYVTLTNTSAKQLQRITDLRLSPLFISVHAVDPQLRKRMLGLRRDDRLLEKISFLATNNIEMHTQIVLCPAWNDGEELDRTVQTLAKFFPQIKTVAVVPVGLTKHRQGLAALRPVSSELAKQLVTWEKEVSRQFLQQFDSAFVYIADEFYLLAGENIPPAERYEGFAQVENGVGMVRQLLDAFEEEKALFPQEIQPTHFSLITGEMAAPILENAILPSLQRIKGLQVTLHPIKNIFFGGGVSVSGLLVGADIADQLSKQPYGDVVVLPPNCLNNDGLFLDDWTVQKLESCLKRSVVLSHGGFLELIELKSL